jgi:hypothetical protein
MAIFLDLLYGLEGFQTFWKQDRFPLFGGMGGGRFLYSVGVDRKSQS